MIKVNDRIVYNGEAGHVTGVHIHFSDDDEIDLRMDNGDIYDHVNVNHVLVTSTIPIKINFAFNVGERICVNVENTDLITRVTKCVELNDGPAYEIADGESTWAEVFCKAAPLPFISNTDLEELFMDYVGKSIADATLEAEHRMFDSSRLRVTILVNEGDGSTLLTYKSCFGYGDDSVADTLENAISESIRREQYKKDHAPKKLVHRR